MAVLGFIVSAVAAWWHVNTWPTPVRLTMIAIMLAFAFIARIGFTHATGRG